MLKIFRKKWVVVVTVAVFAGVGYFIYTKTRAAPTATRYITANVERGTLLVTVSGSGQVSTVNQADVKPKVAGDVVAVGVREGQEVKKGVILVRLDTRDAEKAVRDARTSLETAELSLAKLKEPTDALSILQTEHALVQANESKTQTEENLQKAHEDGFNTTTSVFLDLPGIMSGLQDILLGTDRTLGSAGQWNIDAYADAVKTYNEKATQYRNDAYTKYQDARKKYDASFLTYKATSRFADDAVIEALVRDTYDTARLIAEAVKSANNLIQFYRDEMIKRSLTPQSIATTHSASLSTYTGKVNTHVSSLLAITRTIDSARSSLVGADRTIAERTESLRKLKEGPDPLDIRSQEITIQQRKDTLLDAQQKLTDYTIRAPFDGVIVKVNVAVGDAASSGTAVVTIVTQQKIAEISLNEIDAARVRDGQKTTLTFDAVSGLTVTGEVASIDALGAVSQGVVTYATKIQFDTQDDRVKSGMSVSAAIITDMKPDILLVPNAAIKQQGDTSYVEVLVNNVPQRQIIEVGLANDTMTEVVSGLGEGDPVVTQTITSATTTSSTTGASGLRAFGVGGGTGGARPSGNMGR